VLAAIRVPTLVLHPARARNLRVDAARELAAAISSARLVLLDEDLFLPVTDAATRAIGAFLGIPIVPKADGAVDGDAAPGTVIVLFVDVADSTALTERMGDAAFRSAARSLDDALRAAIRDAGGTAVEGKVLGDGVMAVFTSAARANSAGVRCIPLAADHDLQLHVGLHAGDVIREKDNVYGGAVNIAARICGLSAPGEVLVSSTIRDLARTSAGVTFEDRGEQSLKGIVEPLRVFAVHAAPRTA
jgi:class 3 adenylate cyclase